MFSNRCFSEWCVLQGWSGSTRAEDAKMLENKGVFRHLCPSEGGLPLSQAEVRNLKNTVWKTPFGTLRTIPGRTRDCENPQLRRPKSIHQYCAKGSPTTTLKALRCICIFLLSPLKTSFLVYTKPFPCLLGHLSFQS